MLTDTDRIINDLLDPGSYPERPSSISLIQTHISYIILTPRYAYKIKKPVDFGFLDFSTLDKRLLFCTEEVRLNRRLAPSMYIGVVPIALVDGRARMEADGQAVEWAVKMRRLNESRILSTMLSSNQVEETSIRQIGRIVADFHMASFTDERVSGFGSPEVITGNTEENFSQTERFIGGGSGRAASDETFHAIRSYTEGFISANTKLFTSRMREGRVRDCHGDLHSDHIIIEDGIEIFDCIEFNERFRYSDVVSDIAFLLMDLDFRNRPELASALEDAYFSSTGDSEGKRLLDFYRCYRAFIRAKVECLKSEEKEVPAGERLRALLSARAHLRLARLYAEGSLRPLLIICSGLSGTGKTTLSRNIASITGAVVISSDRIRKELAGLPPDEPCEDRYKEGVYSSAFSALTYAELLSRARGLLMQRRSVILDATYLRNDSISSALATAREAGADSRVVRCVCAEDTVRANILKRQESKQRGGHSDAGWEVYQRQKAELEEIKGDHVKVDTGQRADEALRSAFEKIFD